MCYGTRYAIPWEHGLGLIECSLNCCLSYLRCDKCVSLRIANNSEKIPIEINVLSRLQIGLQNIFCNEGDNLMSLLFYYFRMTHILCTGNKARNLGIRIIILKALKRL